MAKIISTSLLYAVTLFSSAAFAQSIASNVLHQVDISHAVSQGGIFLISPSPKFVPHCKDPSCDGVKSLNTIQGNLINQILQQTIQQPVPDLLEIVDLNAETSFIETNIPSLKFVTARAEKEAFTRVDSDSKRVVLQKDPEYAHNRIIEIQLAKVHGDTYAVLAIHPEDAIRKQVVNNTQVAEANVIVQRGDSVYLEAIPEAYSQLAQLSVGR